MKLAVFAHLNKKKGFIYLPEEKLNELLGHNYILKLDKQNSYSSYSKNSPHPKKIYYGIYRQIKVSLKLTFLGCPTPHLPNTNVKRQKRQHRELKVLVK